MKVTPGSGYVKIEDGGSKLEVRASNPQDLRNYADGLEKQAVRNDDLRAAERAVKYRQAADIWERQQAEAAQAKKAGTAAKRASTQRKKDEFTAGYGEGKERAAARRRLGWEE